MLSVIHVTNGHALKIHRSSRTHFPAGVATMALHHLLLTPPHPFSFSPPLLPLLTPFSSSTHRSISLLTTTNPRPKLYSTALRPTHALLQTLDSGSVPSESALGDFSQWLRKNGAVGSSPPPVKPSFVPEGLGLVAQRDLPRNEVVVEVPKKLWIDADTVAASAIGRVCGGLKPWVAISLFLLREKAMGDASPWRPYLDILPRQTDSTIFW